MSMLRVARNTATNRKLTIAGEYIKKARLNKHLSQEELAIKMQEHGWPVTREMIFRMEKGERIVSIEDASIIRKVLGLDGNELMDYVCNTIDYNCSTTPMNEAE